MNKDRLKLFQDFTITLLMTIEYYYLDQKTLNNDRDMKNHFYFCYNKVSETFIDEEINFRDNHTLRNFFFEYYYDNLYTNPDVNENIFKNFSNFWIRIFKIESNKTQNTLEFLIELYEIFDETIDEKVVFEKIC